MTDDESYVRYYINVRRIGLRFKTKRAEKDAELIAAIRSAKQRPINVGKGKARPIVSRLSPHIVTT